MRTHLSRSLAAASCAVTLIALSLGACGGGAHPTAAPPLPVRVVSAVAEPDGCSDSVGWCYFLMTARTADTKGAPVATAVTATVVFDSVYEDFTGYSQGGTGPDTPHRVDPPEYGNEKFPTYLNDGVGHSTVVMIAEGTLLRYRVCPDSNAAADGCQPIEIKVKLRCGDGFSPPCAP